MAKSAHLVICLDNSGYEVSLERRKIYVVVPDAKAEKHGHLRVVDESGESHLYPEDMFIDAKPGKPASAVEVTNISKHGFWLLIENKERFVPFRESPWFWNATINEILNVELASPRHLHWPDLDVDLAVESIDFPERFPLLSKQRRSTPAKQQKNGKRART